MSAAAWPSLPLAQASGGGALQRALGPLKAMLARATEDISFVPPGSAPLIMIAGGLFAVTFALVLVLVAGAPEPLATGPRGRAAGASGPGRGAGRWGAVPGNVPPLPPPGPGLGFAHGLQAGRALGPVDLDAALDAAERLGLGAAAVLAVDEHRVVVRIAACRSCTQPHAGAGCEFERGFLAGAVRGLRDVRAAEVACGRGAGSACDFELRPGR